MYIAHLIIKNNL